GVRWPQLDLLPGYIQRPSLRRTWWGVIRARPSRSGAIARSQWRTAAVSTPREPDGCRKEGLLLSVVLSCDCVPGGALLCISDSRKSLAPIVLGARDFSLSVQRTVVRQRPGQKGYNDE